MGISRKGRASGYQGLFGLCLGWRQIFQPEPQVGPFREYGASCTSTFGKAPAAAVTLGSCRNAWKNESQHSFGKVPRWEIFPNRGFFPWSFAILLPDGHECLARRIPHWGEGHFFYQFTFGGIKDFRLYNLITCISTVYLFEYLYAYIHIQHMSIYIGSLWMFKSFFTVYRRNICFHYYSMAMNLSCICIIKVSNIHWRSLGGQWICKMVQIQMQHYSILFF